MNRPPRRKRKCLECGRETEAKAQICRPCAASFDPVPLPEGRWVPNGRGVVVFRRADGLPVDRSDAA